MKIFLVNPPFKTEYGKFSRDQRSPAITKSGTIYYPTWLASATGVLEEAGHNCKLLDYAMHAALFIRYSLHEVSWVWQGYNG